MLLIFPNGEHSQWLLKPGVNRLGSVADSDIVLSQPGISPLHCEIYLNDVGAHLQVPVGVGSVSVNDKSVNGLMAVRVGDTLQIGPVLAKLGSEVIRKLEPAAVVLDEELGATRVRTTLPKYVLRGLSGAVLGKIFSVNGTVVIGRAVECDISVPADEISRRHAQLKPTAEGLSVEDLDSANGTYINGGRVQKGFLGPGDELRLDAVRFILVAPGMDIAAQIPKVPTTSSATASKALNWMPMLLTAVALLVIVLLVFKR